MMRSTKPAAVFLAIAACATARADDGVTYDNGLSFINGLSHLTDPHRSILDDFVVDSPDGWTITGLEFIFGWADGSTGTGTDLELTIYGDAGGAPDFDNVVAVPKNRLYDERLYDCDFFLCWVIVSIDFDGLFLPPGTYWAEFHEVGPINGFQLVSNEVHGSSVWVDYEDFGGRQPGREVFSDDYDVNFIFTGVDHSSTMVPPKDYTIVFGRHWWGDVRDLQRSDDQWLFILQRPAVSTLLPLIRVEVEGTAQVDDAASITVTVEAATESQPGQSPQKISMFDYDAARWEIVDERIATLEDSVAQATVTDDPGRFIEDGARTVRLRVDWFDPGAVIHPNWRVRIDQAVWDVVDRRGQLNPPPRPLPWKGRGRWSPRPRTH